MMELTEEQNKIYNTLKEGVKKYGKAGSLYTLVVHPDNYENAKQASKKYNREARKENRKDRVTVKTIKLDNITINV